MFFYISNNRKLVTGLLIVVLIEMMLAVQINVPMSVVTEYKPALVHADVGTLPQGFVIPPADDVIDFTEAGKVRLPLWRNMNLFFKLPGWDGFNNFVLSNYVKFINSPLKDVTLQNPLVYLSDSVLPLNSFEKEGAKGISPYAHFFEEDDFQKLKNADFKHNAVTDTTYITVFDANRIQAQVRTQNRQVLTLLQCYYQGWDVTIDNSPADIFISNYAFMSVIVPPGEHIIDFSYNFKPVKIAFIITVISLIFMIASIVFILIQKNRKHRKPFVQV